MDRSPFRSFWLWAVVLLMAAFPVTAYAHTPIKGMGDFVSGLLHPLITPTHVLLILGLALLMGQHVPLDFKTPLRAFIPFSAAGLALTMTGLVTAVYPAVLIALALCAAALVALEWRPPPLVCIFLFSGAALALGLDSAVETGSTGAVIRTLLGTWVSLVLLVLDLAFYISLCPRKPWLKVGLRVMGSWIIAIAMLLLAFSLRK